MENIADRYGIDSALKTALPYTEIARIDTTIALSLALRCSELKNNSKQFYYFTSTGQAIKNESLNSKAIENIKDYKILFLDTIAKSYQYFVIPDQIFHVVLFQNDSSIIPVLISEFNFWERAADSIKKTYPSKTKRFLQRFKGTPPSEQLFSDCKENSYKLAWTLSKLGYRDFTVEYANAIKQKLAPNKRDYDMERWECKEYKFRSDTLELKSSYTSTDELDFETEPELLNLNKLVYGGNCLKQMITNGKSALYEIGCSRARLAGEGTVIMLKLIESNRLQIIQLTSWRS